MKFARVNLEPESFGDPRFAHLARLLALPGGDGHFALIKVALIWSWQTEHYTPEAPCFHVPEDVVEMALGVDGAAGRAALVRARLAEETPEGLRMRGSNHDRTGWLWRIRDRAEAGGRAKAENAKRKRANESLPIADDKQAVGMPEETPLSSLLSVPEDLSHTGGAREAGQEPPKPPSPTANPDSPGALVMAAADRLTVMRRNIDPAAMPITEANAREVVARLVEAGPDARRRLEHAMACVEARSKVTRTVDALGWSSFASARAWAFVQQSSVKGYAEAGDPRARGRPGDGQPRRQPQPQQLRGAAAARALAERLEAEEQAR